MSEEHNNLQICLANSSGWKFLSVRSQIESRRTEKSQRQTQLRGHRIIADITQEVRQPARRRFEAVFSLSEVTMNSSILQNKKVNNDET